MILRARTILPVSRPPVENGAVAVSGNRIRAAGPWPDIKSLQDTEILDLGEVILLPGLINAHCHLDYTDMAGQLPPPKSFVHWISLIIAAKQEWGFSNYAHSWLRGTHMLLAGGVTTVADTEAMPDLLPELWNATPLRVFSFLEMTGIRARRDPGDVLYEAIEKMDSLAHDRSTASLSPHAPYSTLPKLLRLTGEAGRRKNLRIMTHVSESKEEFEMFMHGRGEMFDWLKRNERDNSDCGLGSPVQHLARCGMLGENLTAVHVNLLADGDAALLGQHGVHVVHCPRSHEYFHHPPFPRRQLADAGVNICLGTDSLATTLKGGKTPELSLFDEMRLLADDDPELSPVEIIRMVTVNGARSLGMAGQAGELSENALADLIAISAPKTGDLYEAVLAHAGPVKAGMIGGQWAISPQTV